MEEETKLVFKTLEGVELPPLPETLLTVKEKVFLDRLDKIAELLEEQLKLLRVIEHCVWVYESKTK